MVKRLTSMIALLLCIFMVQAQQMPQLPLNPNVKHGVLKNGMSYYILHNEEPKGRANFYIAQKVGSSLETSEQLGLAHFLEHMAFNGSTNFPGKSMLEYLQDKGVRFGADINAYTGFDETVYRINNVPTSDVALMDSVLLVLHDWSSDLLLEDSEIDAERGVIQEEWRTRNNAQTRMFEAYLPQLYKEPQYTQMPIGTMDVVMNFPYKVLRDYYHKWYRPDQQGIVVVGDFDAAEMEQKVIALMNTINMPENAAERTYPTVSDNDDLIYATFQDPELKNQLIRFSIKRDKTPYELRAGLDYYVESQFAERLISSMIDSRLGELAVKPDCAFAYAGVTFGDYWVSKTKGTFDIVVVPKTDPKAALQQAMAEVVRACKTGFTDSELARAKESIKSAYEKLYNERDKTDSDALAQELIRNFIDNEPAPGIEIEWQLAQMALPAVTVPMLNELAATIITPNNQVLALSMPTADGALPARDEMVQLIETTMAQEYEAFVDDVVDEPLVPTLPTKGSVTATKELPQFGATQLTLSNGATVLVKTTDFAADQILFAATAKGGKMAYNAADAANIIVLPMAVEVSALGNFTTTQMQKALAGKHISSSYFMGNYSCGLQGSSTVKDLESLMQVIYLQFTAINPDKEGYAAMSNQYEALLANQEKNPDFAFSKALSDARYNHNPLMAQLTAETIKAADYDKMLDIARKSLTNAADFDFIFVGNVDVETLRPLLEQYIASLPSKGKATKSKQALLTSPKGIVENEFQFPMESPQVKEFVQISGTGVKYNPQNNVNVEFVGDILDIIYTRTLREEIGGTYGASVGSGIDPRTGEWRIIYAYDTGADTKKALNDRAVSDLNELLQNGATPEDFNKVKEAAITQYGLSLKKNGYWMGVLQSWALMGIDTNAGMEQALKSITLPELNKFMKKLDVNKNRIHVVLDGVAK